MRVLVVNPIPYTSETKNIQRAKSIKDTMIYDLCLSFHQEGHDVTLFCAEPFRPTEEESYPFQVLWCKSVWQRIFQPHRFPVIPEIWKYIRNNRKDIDLIVSSEVFSMNSLMAYRIAPDKTVIWHELAKHNAMLKQVPSKIWYNIVARSLMSKAKISARSNEAKAFIARFCKNVSDTVIDHGVNLDKFQTSEEKDNTFVVCSQLIERKKIDGILRHFAEYLQQYDPAGKLTIIGEGEKKEALVRLAEELNITDHVVFTGKLPHEKIVPTLSRAQALLVNTVQDNNMISIVESIAVGTPVLTTEVPLNAAYIKSARLGIAKTGWNAQDLHLIKENNAEFAANCLQYRQTLSTRSRVDQLIAALRRK